MRKTIALFAVALAGVASADVGVVPPAYATTPGTSTFLYMVTSARTYQYIIDSSQLTAFVGKNLNGLQWRLPTSATTTWPPANVNFASFDIYIGPGVAVSSASSTLANNYTSSPTQVRSGALAFSAGAFTNGSTPNAFGPVVTFNNYLYTGGNLTVEMRHTGMTGTTTTRSFDALSTATSGYGTLFAARWIGNGTGTGTAGNGNFFVTQFNATPVPEPATLAALGLGAAALIRRRRRP